MKTLTLAALSILIIASIATAKQNDETPVGDDAGLVAHYFKDVDNWGGAWPDKASIPNASPDKWTFGAYKYSRVEPVINHLFVSNGWFSVRWTGFIDPAGLVDSGIQSHSVGGDLNINPNNNAKNEFTLYLPDGRFITRADLTQDFAGYNGPAVRVHVKPKGNGNQNGLMVDGQPFDLLNANTYDIESSFMTIKLYNDSVPEHGKAMGKWWISISAQDARITCTDDAGQATEVTVASTPKTGKTQDLDYVFQIWADDGCRFFIDDKLVIDGWQACWEQSPEALRTGTPTKMTPGKHKIAIEYFQGQSLQANDKDPMKFYWSAPAAGIQRQIVPLSCFTHNADNLKTSAR